MTKKPNKYKNKETKLRLNGQVVKSKNFKLFTKGESVPFVSGEGTIKQLRNIINEFVEAKGNYSTEQLYFLHQLKNGSSPDVYRAAFKAKGLI